jgi:hypothetical protein
MRTYGRIPANPLEPNGPTKWTVIETDANGFNDLVYVTTLIQVFLLNLGESPFWANYGIPARQSVLQSIPPDFAVAFTQQRFANYFANLTITKIANTPPTYRAAVLTHQGVVLKTDIPIAK